MQAAFTARVLNGGSWRAHNLHRFGQRGPQLDGLLRRLTLPVPATASAPAVVPNTPYLARRAAESAQHIRTLRMSSSGASVLHLVAQQVRSWNSSEPTVVNTEDAFLGMSARKSAIRSLS